MVDVAPVEALDHELAGEAEVLAAAEGLLVDVLRREVLRDAAVVRVRELRRVHLVVKQVVYIHIVHITLDALEVDVRGLLLRGSCPIDGLLHALVVLNSTHHSAAVVSSFIHRLFILILRVVLIGLLEPVMSKDLGNSQAVPRIKPDHPSHDLLGVLT